MNYKGYTISIDNDMDPMNPRKEHCNVAKMVLFHKKYQLGDEHDYDYEDYHGWEEMKDEIIRIEEPVLISPVYMYDHSGITISHKPFSCPWDSGQIGFVFVTDEALKQAGLTSQDAERIIESELEIYDQYLRNEIYQYSIEKDGEFVDSLCGCYGEDYCLSEAKAAIDRMVAV